MALISRDFSAAHPEHHAATDYTRAVQKWRPLYACLRSAMIHEHDKTTSPRVRTRLRLFQDGDDLFFSELTLDNSPLALAGHPKYGEVTFSHRLILGAADQIHDKKKLRTRGVYGEM